MTLLVIFKAKYYQYLDETTAIIVTIASENNWASGIGP